MPSDEKREPLATFTAGTKSYRNEARGIRIAILCRCRICRNCRDRDLHFSDLTKLRVEPHLRERAGAPIRVSGEIRSKSSFQKNAQGRNNKWLPPFSRGTAASAGRPEIIWEEGRTGQTICNLPRARLWMALPEGQL